MPALYGISAAALGWYFYQMKGEGEAKCWLYRDDIGAFWGIKGYEEQVTEVGTHHGHMQWPQFSFFGAYNAGSVRRGFQVFARNCSNCHGIMYKKYDAVLDKGYRQVELAKMLDMFSISPGHHHFKQYYYQEWEERPRYIHDHIYSYYISQDHAKNMNGGVWPTDFSKIRFRPGGINYIYNILTGYHYKAPYGLDVPQGKYFNPYFTHMVIGMKPPLDDGTIDYDDGTPNSHPQMAYDVANFITFMQRRTGGKYPDRVFRLYVLFLSVGLLYPLRYLHIRAYWRSLLSLRYELYAVRDGVYYKHYRHGMRNNKTPVYRRILWA